MVASALMGLALLLRKVCARDQSNSMFLTLQCVSRFQLYKCQYF